MARRKSFKKELARRRAIAAALLLEGALQEHIPGAMSFTRELTQPYRLQLRSYLNMCRITPREEDRRDITLLGTEVEMRLSAAPLGGWGQQRRGTVMRLCLWGWNPYPAPKPSGFQRERGRKRVRGDAQPAL